MRSHLERLGISVELNTELRSFEQFPDHVIATIVKHEDEKDVVETVQYQYLVGTDGGRSAYFRV